MMSLTKMSYFIYFFYQVIFSKNKFQQFIGKKSVNIFIILHLFMLNVFLMAYPTTILLQPMCDSKNLGRMIGDYFECSVNVKSVHILKKEIELLASQRGLSVTVIIGLQQEDQRAKADYANIIKPDIALVISSYAEIEQVNDQLFIFYRQADYDKVIQQNRLVFVPYEQVHRLSLDNTKKYADILFANLIGSSNVLQCVVHQPTMLMLSTTIGFSIPTLHLEFGFCVDQRVDFTTIADKILMTLSSM
jgi:hypothetical protein